MNPPSITPEEIERRFSHHPPRGGQVALYEDNRDQYMRLATHIGKTLPASREAALALTALQESLMWANAAIACNGVGAAEEAPES